MMNASTGFDGWFWVAALSLGVAVVMAVLVLMPGAVKAGEGYRRHFSGRVGHGMKDLLLFVDVDRLFRANLLLCLVACALVWLLTGSLFLVLVSVALLGALPSLLIAHLGAQRRKQFARQLPDAMMLIGGAVRAGASMTLALRQMASELPAPGGQEFDLLLRELRLGVTLDDALFSLENAWAVMTCGSSGRQCGLPTKVAATWRRRWNGWPTPCARKWRWKTRSWR